MPRRGRSQLAGGGRSGDRDRALVPEPEPRERNRHYADRPLRLSRTPARAPIVYIPSARDDARWISPTNWIAEGVLERKEAAHGHISS